MHDKLILLFDSEKNYYVKHGKDSMKYDFLDIYGQLLA